MNKLRFVVALFIFGALVVVTYPVIKLLGKPEEGAEYDL